MSFSLQGLICTVGQPTLARFGNRKRSGAGPWRRRGRGRDWLCDTSSHRPRAWLFGVVLLRNVVGAMLPDVPAFPSVLCGPVSFSPFYRKGRGHPEEAVLPGGGRRRPGVMVEPVSEAGAGPSSRWTQLSTVRGRFGSRTKPGEPRNHGGHDGAVGKRRA